MSTTVAKIAALAKTENTGITPGLAHKMYDKLGSKHIAIVEFKVAERTEGDDDSHAVKLEIRAVEPADDRDTDEYLRELQRALYRKRNPQPALTAKDSTEPTVDAVVAGGEIQLNCPECEIRYVEKGVAHTKGLEDGYLPCSYRVCGHVAIHGQAKCEREHPAELHLAS